jgi:hypothetical protein
MVRFVWESERGGARVASAGLRRLNPYSCRSAPDQLSLPNPRRCEPGTTAGATRGPSSREYGQPQLWKKPAMIPVTWAMMPSAIQTMPMMMPARALLFWNPARRDWM